MIKRLFTTPRIGMTLGDGICLLIVGALLFLIVSCCNPDKPIVTAPMCSGWELHSPGLLSIKGFDENCDGDIDYWQHYNSFGEKVGKPIWIRRK